MKSCASCSVYGIGIVVYCWVWTSWQATTIGDTSAVVSGRSRTAAQPAGATESSSTGAMAGDCVI